MTIGFLYEMVFMLKSLTTLSLGVNDDSELSHFIIEKVPSLEVMLETSSGLYEDGSMLLDCDF